MANSNNSLRSIDSLFEIENTSIKQIMSLEYFYEFLENKEENDLQQNFNFEFLNELE